MEIKKNCNNCAYAHIRDRLHCIDCWNQSNWLPNERVQRRVLDTINIMDSINKYIKEDIEMAKTSYNHYFSIGDFVKTTTKIQFTNGHEMDIRDNIKDVIFNDPATIILWKDGSKTVVKTQDVEAYDPEKGFAMAIAKKVLGGQGNYYEVFKKWVPDVDVAVNTVQFELTLMPDISKASECIQEIQESVYKHFGVIDKAEEDNAEE